MKWYLGGIAGDDFEAADRIGRDQLDGIGGGAWLCERYAPSMRVLRLVGLFQTRDESCRGIVAAARLLDILAANL